MNTWTCTRQGELYHHGIKGQKWGVRRFQNKDGSVTPAGARRYYDGDENRKKNEVETTNKKSKNNKTHYNDDEDIVIKKGSEIHRMVPKEWVEKEKTYSGHAYASFKKEDVEKYKSISRFFGGDNYVDMTFTAKETIVSPSRKKRVDEFIKLMDSDPAARQALLKSTRGLLTFMPKKTLEKLDDPKQAEKAFRKFSFHLVSNKDLRDPYFKRLEEQGYTMVIDDADSMGGISKSPVIIFDRTKSLSLKSTNRVGSKEEGEWVERYKKEHPNTKLTDGEIMDMFKK